MKLHQLQRQPSILIFPKSKIDSGFNLNAAQQHNSNTTFLSAITHELKTPLSAIIGFADVLQQEIRNPNSIEECVDYIKEIREAAADLNSLIHDLLDIGQVSSGNFSADLSKKIDVCDVIKRAVRLNYDYALRRNISLKVEISSEIKPINLDAKRMKQILMNLISNAVKYSRDGSEIKISARVTNDILEISVSDQGFGMSPEQLKIAFTKYGTIANENSHQVDSLGLGLPITKQLVELQNGIIEAESKIGVGTKMIIKFPHSM